MNKALLILSIITLFQSLNETYNILLTRDTLKLANDIIIERVNENLKLPKHLDIYKNIEKNIFIFNIKFVIKNFILKNINFGDSIMKTEIGADNLVRIHFKINEIVASFKNEFKFKYLLNINSINNLKFEDINVVLVQKNNSFKIETINYENIILDSDSYLVKFIGSIIYYSRYFIRKIIDWKVIDRVNSFIDKVLFKDIEIYTNNNQTYFINIQRSIRSYNENNEEKIEIPINLKSKFSFKPKCNENNFLKKTIKELFFKMIN